MSFRGRFLTEIGKKRHAVHQLGLESGPDVQGMVCYPPSIAIFELLLKLNNSAIQLEVF